MRVENSVGDRDCECGHVADIRQSKKAGRYLYSVCPGCKTNQATGAYWQNLWWHTMRLYDGVSPLRPSNVSDDWVSPASKVSEPVTEKPVELAAELATEKPSEPEQSSPDLTVEELEPEPVVAGAGTEVQPKKRNWLGYLAGFLFCSGILGAVWAAR